MVKTITVNENVYANNDNEANALRNKLTASHTYMINVMSSPGSGKTTLLSNLINQIKDDLKVAVMDVDIKTDLDASKIQKATGVESIQINNGGLCHIDAFMTKEAIEKSNLKVADYDLLILENIGNLVCPAEFDTGAHKNIMLLSVPEGDDKPLKYPLMFSICDLVIITKIDTKPIFTFDIDKCRKYITDLNKNAKIIEVSAKTNEGMDELKQYIYDCVRK